MRRCVLLLMVSCLLLPLASGHGDGDGHPEPFQERTLDGALGLMDLHGTRLAWAGVRDGNVELVVTDLKDGTEFVATRVPAIGQQPIQSLAFDGRWVAWTDGRYGNLDAFAIDTESGRLLRLSDHSQDDGDIDVEDGRFAWVRGGVMVSDGTGAAQAVPGSGASFEPKFAGGWLVWSQVQDQRRVLRGQYLADGTVHTLADNEGVIHKSLDAFGGHVVWVGVADKVARIYARALHVDGTLGGMEVLTDWGGYAAPRTGGGHVAWIDQGSGMLRVERFSDGQVDAIPATRSVLLSQELMILYSSDSEGVHVMPMEWDEWGAGRAPEVRDARPYLVAAGVAVLAGGAGLQWWRARRQGRD